MDPSSDQVSKGILLSTPRDWKDREFQEEGYALKIRVKRILSGDEEEPGADAAAALKINYETRSS